MIRPLLQRGWILFSFLLCAQTAQMEPGRAVPPPSSPKPLLQIWTLERGRLACAPGASPAPIPVGSLQKPFVAKAWAAAHPGEATPRFRCGPDSGCWLPAGHGELGLARALAVSCNAYFRRLAADTPREAMEAAFRAEGFSLLPLTPDLAIGLAGPQGPLLIHPGDLLEAYVRLAREPWPAGESVRAEVLEGLREAALDGTAGALGQRGWWAKTGTVPSSDGDATHTTGLLAAVDDSGWAVLARLEPGTGREAAAALAPDLARLRPWQAPSRAKPRAAARSKTRRGSPRPPADPDRVRIRMLDLLGAHRMELRNLGEAPIPAGGTYLGAGSARALRAGDRFGPGLLELHDPETGLVRRFEGSLACGRTPKGALSLTATVTRREYVAGVLAAELPRASTERRIDLGAAVLRFLMKGPRHAGADVCDTTHCAWFVGRGPRLEWVAPRRSQIREGDRALALRPRASFMGSEDPSNGIPDADWKAMLDASSHPGPALWTAHCGGAPLSPHAIWGNGDTTITPCPRHGPENPRPWDREWKAEDLARAFGTPVRNLRVEWLAGTWNLWIEGEREAWTLRYDEAHRRLAAVLGWDALPSPADAVEPVPGGFRARGVGWGHRVGLCLGD